MGEEILVEGQVADTIKFVNKLGDLGIRTSFAVWYYYDDLEDWRLLIAGPDFDEILSGKPEAAYKNVVDAMKQADVSSISISDVKLVKTTDPLPQAIRRVLTTSESGFSRAHFTNNYIDGVFLKDMVVLRSAIT